jgi:hypothetical protein
MSQRECSGFNWPPLSIAASEPVNISPEAVSLAGPCHSGHVAGKPDAATSGAMIPAAISAICSNPGGLLCPPPDRRPLFVESVIARDDFRSVDAIGVGQPAKLACWGRGCPVSCGRIVPLPREQSCAVGVDQPASFACIPRSVIVAWVRPIDRNFRAMCASPVPPG